MRSAFFKLFIFSALICGAAAARGQVNPNTQIRWPGNCYADAYHIYNPSTNTCISIGAISPASQITWPGSCTGPNNVYAPGTNTCVVNGTAANPAGTNGQPQFNNSGVMGAYTPNGLLGWVAPGTSVDGSNNWQFPAGVTGSLFTGPGTGLTGTAAGLTAGSANAFLSSGQPVLDSRNPVFGGGWTCNNSADGQAAFQAMLNALPIKGGLMQAVGLFTAGQCRINNPNLLTWPHFTGSQTIYLQGNLRVGTTLVLNNNNYLNGAPLNVVGIGGGATAQFQAATSPATIELSPTSGTCAGTLGTAVSTTDGVGVTVTFTPSTPPSSNPCFQSGSWMTVADVASCTIASISRSGGTDTAILTGSCHFITGTPVVSVTGVADTSFNTSGAAGKHFDFTNPSLGWLIGTYDWCGDSSHSCSLSWKDPGADATSSGGTITAFTPDTLERVHLTNCAGTSCDGVFFRTHTSAAKIGIDAVVLGNDGTGSTADIAGSQTMFTDVNIINPYGTGLDLQGQYKGILKGVGITTTNMYNQGNNANWPLVIGASSYIKIVDSAFMGSSPFSIQMTNRWNDGAAGSGPIYFYESYVGSGIYMDHGASGVQLTNVSTEHIGAAVVTFNPTNYWNGNPSHWLFQNVNGQDAYSGTSPCMLAFTSPSFSDSINGYVAFNQNAGPSCLVNSYAHPRMSNVVPGGIFKYDNGNEWTGPRGTLDTGRFIEANIRGSGANFSPSVLPHATVNITDPSTWAGTGSCTVTGGQLAPDGTNTAYLITSSSGQCAARIFQSGSYTGVVGDMFLAHMWVWDKTAGVTEPVAYQVADLGTNHYAFQTGGLFAPDSSPLQDDWWHVENAVGRVVSTDGVAAGYRMYIYGNIGHNLLVWNPGLAAIPASDGFSEAEVLRWAQQEFHGYMPNNAVAGKSYSNAAISLPADPVASLDAATKHYVDTAAAGITGPVSSVIGDCVNWADVLGKVLNDAGAPCGSGGGGTTLLEYVTPGVRTAGTAFAVNATRLYSFQIIGGSITATKLTYQLSAADNTGNFYDIGYYSSTGTLLCHLGATAGTTFSPSASTFTLSIASCPTFTAGTRYLLGITTNCAASCAGMYGVGSTLEAVGNAAPSAGSVTAGGVLNGSITPPADSWAGNPSMPEFSLHN